VPQLTSDQLLQSETSRLIRGGGGTFVSLLRQLNRTGRRSRVIYCLLEQHDFATEHVHWPGGHLHAAPLAHPQSALLDPVEQHLQPQLPVHAHTPLTTHLHCWPFSQQPHLQLPVAQQHLVPGLHAPPFLLTQQRARQPRLASRSIPIPTAAAPARISPLYRLAFLLGYEKANAHIRRTDSHDPKGKGMGEFE
jgi:hypothetical protein